MVASGALGGPPVSCWRAWLKGFAAGGSFRTTKATPWCPPNLPPPAPAARPPRPPSADSLPLLTGVLACVYGVWSLLFTC